MRGPNDPVVAAEINNIAGVLRDLGDMEGAREGYQRAMEIDEAVFGADSPMVAIRANNLAGILQYMGDLEGARELFEQASRVLEQTRGEAHPATQLVQNNLDSMPPEQPQRDPTS